MHGRRITVLLALALAGCAPSSLTQEVVGDQAAVTTGVQPGETSTSGAPAPPTRPPAPPPTPPTRPPTPPPTPPTTAPDPPSRSDRAYAFCDSPDEARAYLVGVVWADGGIAGGTAQIRTPSKQRADAAEAAGRCAGLDPSRERDGEDWKVRFPGVSGSEVNQAGTPPDLDHGADDVRTKAFLAGVIEGEGSRTSGLVVDDTHDGHLDAIPPMLDRVGIRWYQRGNKVYAERADWPRFATFPFAVFDRVPGHGITWG